MRLNFMENNLIKFEIDDESILKATLICYKLGINLETYLRICINRLILEDGIPFEMKIKDEPSSGMKAILEAERISKDNGNSEMTLDEINEIIKSK